MARKVILVNDPGIDGAFAIALALHEPQLEVVGLAASAGNVSAEQANQNVHVLVGQLDPRRWPRFGAALPVDYDINGHVMHGPGGLGGVELALPTPQHWPASDKLIVELAHEYPREIELVVLGPLTAVARALDRDPELPALLRGIICMGGSWHLSSYISPVAEFHFYCDPLAARQVLHSGVPLTLIPLDVSRKILFSPTDLLDLLSNGSPTHELLRQMASYAIGATSSVYGVEGVFLNDVVAIAAVVHPEMVTTKPMVVDVETHGHLTRGMCVVDNRWTCKHKPNVELAVSVDDQAVREYVRVALRHHG